MSEILLKRTLAEAAVEQVWKLFSVKLKGEDGERPFIFGLGTGSTVAIFWEKFVTSIRKANLNSHKSLVIIPTSYQSRELVLNSDVGQLMMIGDLEQFSEIDCLVDGFDKVGENGVMIKGGGGAHVVEKLVAAHSRYNLYLGTEDKCDFNLGKQDESIPIEVIPAAVAHVEKTLGFHGGRCQRRTCKGGKMGPVVSDNGNIILDWLVPGGSPLWSNLELLDQSICSVVGVVGSGIFVSLANCIMVINKEGQIYSYEFNRK